MDVGDRIGAQGRYLIEDCLGKGGMGTVYLARDSVLNRLVAVKVIADELAEAGSYRARFRREAQLLARLRHPNLVQVYDIEITEMPPYMVQEYLDGMDLEEMVACGTPLGPDAARAMAKTLADALAYLHGERVLHRDIKPSNIFFDVENRLRLMDFGLARPLDQTRMTLETQILGSVVFMPPEVIAGAAHSPAGDVYQVGLVLHIALTGRHLHGECDDIQTYFRRVMAEGWRHDDVDRTIPRDIREFIETCCRRAPDERPKNGSELIRLAEKLGSPPRLALHRKRKDAARPLGAGTGVGEKAVPAGPSTHPVESWFRSLRMVAALVLLTALGALMVARTVTRDDVQEETVFDEALEWVLLPDGFSLVLPRQSVDRPTWNLTAPGMRTQRGYLRALETSWALKLSGLVAGKEATLTIEEGGTVRGKRLFTVPRERLRQPVYARFGHDAVSLSWQLHGHGTVDVTLETKGGEVLACERVRGTSCTIRLQSGAARHGPISYRLELRGTELASGEGVLQMGNDISEDRQDLDD